MAFRLNEVHMIQDKVMFLRIGGNDTTSGGIHIPETARELGHTAEVFDVGPGAKDKDGKIIPMLIRVGDIIVISPYAGTELPLKGQTYGVLREQDILALYDRELEEA